MPETYDATKFVLLRDLKAEAQKAKTAITAAQNVANGGIRSGNVSGNTVSFYTSTDHSGDAVFSFDFPSELVLDQVKTTFVSNFTFVSATYPGATDPSLNGKPVLVLAVKDTAANGTVTTTYSFLDMTKLVDTYVPADNSININGYNVSVKVSATTGNHLTVENDGLMVNVNDKADKVSNATSGDVATLDANGNLTDSGHGIATDTEVNAMLTEVWGA